MIVYHKKLKSISILRFYLITQNQCLKEQVFSCTTLCFHFERRFLSKNPLGLNVILIANKCIGPLGLILNALQVFNK
jgi:hypothetical protein